MNGDSHSTAAALAAMLSPAAMVTACSLLLLGVYDKYSKVVAGLRSLNSERRRIDAGDGFPAERDSRRASVDRQCVLLRRRLSSTLQQMRSIASATVLFLATSVLIGAAQIAGADESAIALLLMCLGILALAYAMLLAFREAGTIAAIVDIESRPERRQVCRWERTENDNQ